MWPFSSRCKHNKLSPKADDGYRCDRQNGHNGAHTCTVEVSSGDWRRNPNTGYNYRDTSLFVKKWWTCIGCGLAAPDNNRLCEDCKKDD